MKAMFQTILTAMQPQVLTRVIAQPVPKSPLISNIKTFVLHVSVTQLLRVPVHTAHTDTISIVTSFQQVQPSPTLAQKKAPTQDLRRNIRSTADMAAHSSVQILMVKTEAHTTISATTLVAVQILHSLCLAQTTIFTALTLII